MITALWVSFSEPSPGFTTKVPGEEEEVKDDPPFPSATSVSLPTATRRVRGREALTKDLPALVTCSVSTLARLTLMPCNSPLSSGALETAAAKAAGWVGRAAAAV